MEKNSRLPTAATTAILTVITLFFWIGFEVYRAFTTKPAPTVPAEVLTQIDPVLDTETLNKLPGRVELNDQEIGNTIVAGTITPAPTAIPTAIPTSTPVASSSGSPVGTSTPTPTSTP